MGRTRIETRRPPNVLLVSSKYPPEYSGSGLRAHKTYKRLARKFGVRFDVLCGSVTFDRSESYEYDGARVFRVTPGVPFFSGPPESANDGHSLRRRARAKLDYLFEILRVFTHLLPQRKNYDLIHIFGSSRVTSGAVSFAKVFDIPFMLEITSDRQSPHVYEPCIVKLIRGSSFPSSTQIVCGSEKQREMCRRHGYVDNVWCRPHPVDETKFFPEASRKREYRCRYTGFREDDTVLSYVAKFMPTKNQLFLIDVMRLLPERFKLVMGGPVVTLGPLSGRDVSYLDGVRGTIARHELGNRVEIVEGFIDSPAEFMKLADVYVLPSTSEGLPNPLLEAVACGVPVVANRLEGITDTWIDPGKNGFVSGLDPREFADKVIAAAQIPAASLAEESQRALAAASTEVIDRQYWDRIKALTGTA
ncbi:MAG: glycosyltransferase family 4 protein [Chloroflexi bacterium]|nr:glycosyltransferase family 4 protein [Chloroflexota bacterium]